MVERSMSEVEFFSIWPIWLIFWKQVAAPFEIVLETQAPGLSRNWEKPKNEEFQQPGGGDVMRWTVDLGPPFLRLTTSDVEDADFRTKAVAFLRGRIAYDR